MSKQERCVIQVRPHKKAGKSRSKVVDGTVDEVFDKAIGELIK